MESVNAVGRRKAAIARVIVKEGNGAITINCNHDRRTLDKYFPSSILQYIVLQPLKTLDCVEKYDIAVILPKKWNFLSGEFSHKDNILCY